MDFFYDLVPQVSKAEIPNGWTMNNFGAYQKVNKNFYAYVTPIFGGFTTQLYQRRTAAFCELEARTDGSAAVLFTLAQRWLDMYGDGTLEKVRANYYHISNPNGAWGSDYHLKTYWVK